ncbi:MAG: FecR family protein [Candidatus Cloacimonetes bacterium]|nr:FecR family protein [Candidatus Cloacimonadota bacterium]MCF7813724.1 FecR family protein [Candidatus Cloacimonadota bacterium]MCF7867790.1 FecR family protein [Candidatus Cloacimonadota bacterium]MCF7883232.1 FecR family protein [Candidatus Cloacimonadota bacterium]
MKNLTTFLLLIIAVSLFAADPVAFMIKAKGEIELNRDEEKMMAEEGQNLINKDELISKEQSFAVVKFIDGSSSVKLFPNSILTIEAEQEDDKLNKRSTLMLGGLLAQVKKKTGIFEVDTPNNVVSVKGTQFMVEVGESGRASVSVKEGEVSIKNKQTSNEVSVTSGQKAAENEAGEFTFSDVSADEFEEIYEEKGEDIKEVETLKIEMENEDGEIEIIEIEFEKR